MAKRRPVLAALRLECLGDFERSVENLSPFDADRQLPGFSSIGWIVAHVAQHLDSWVIGSLAGQPRNRYLIDSKFGKGVSGAGGEWAIISLLLSETLAKSRAFLENVAGTFLEKESVYEGSMLAVRGKTITGNYRLARLAAHLYYHIGEITTIRSTMGHKAVDFPGILPISIEARQEK